MKSFFLVVLTTLLISVAAFAQTTTGRLIGTVAGADGALIPGATVVVTDAKTGKDRSLTTDGEGSFNVSLLDYGVYSVKVTAQGFKTSTTSITIESGKEYALNVGMEVGEVSENVTVTAGTDVINSTNAELTNVISNRQITELPLAARNPLSLILTQAGSSSNPSQNTSINGGRTSSTNITRDGVNINDNFIRSNATDFSPGRPSVDNVEEFSLSSQSAVDSGFGSAQVTLVTPRGGNQFHGAVWEYNRNDAVGANTFFGNAANSARAPRNRNQYGFKVAGPILKDRLFFFVFGEKLNDIISANKLVTVLTPSAKAGLFTYINGGTRTANIFTPGVITPSTVTGNPVPTGINAFVQSRYLATMPAGNTTEAGDGLNTTGYRFTQKANTTRDALTSRVDYDLNEKNNINAVIDYNFENNFRSDLGGTDPIPLVIQPARNVTYSGGWRFSPTATLNNEFRIGRFYSQPDFFRTDANPVEYYLTTLITNPEPLNGAAIFRPQGRAVKTFNMQDTVSWLLGNHSLRMGAQYQKSEIIAYNDAGTLATYQIGLSVNGPTVNFANLGAAGGAPITANAQIATANSLVALLGGILSSGSRTFNANPSSGYVPGLTRETPFTFQLFAPYVVDSWKVRSGLTITGGLRWDYQTPLTIDSGAHFEPVIAEGRSAVDAVLDPNGTYRLVGGNAGIENAFYKKDKNNFAPSFGFAWAPKNLGSFFDRLTGADFVIRGGFRRSYVNDELVTAPNNALVGNAGFQTGVSASILVPGPNGPVANTGLDDRIGSHTSTLPVPSFTTTRTYTQNNAAVGFGNFGTVFAVDPNLKVPTQNDYTLGIQRRFGDWVAEARYVGGYSKDMLRTIDYNQIRIPDAFRSQFDIVRGNVATGCATSAACAVNAPLFLSLVSQGNITATNANGLLVRTGQIAELAFQLLANGNIPNANVFPVPSGNLRAQFLPNPNTGVANVLENGGSYFYNSGQFELRRQFKSGLYLQANYTFSKELTDAIGTGQTRVEPFLDNNNRSLDYARADYDQTHVFNMNAIYELPFGKNRRFLNKNSFLDYVIGGWQLGLIWRLGSGAPITFTDARGTLNRTGRSGRQTALTSLTPDQLKNVVGVFKTRCGVFFVDPAFININQTNLANGNCTALNAGIAAGTTGGAGASGFAQPTFGGQIFFNNGPLQTGGLRRAVVNGPSLSSADISLLKNFRIGERVTFQLRGEAYNFTNSPYFVPGQVIDINSTTFGRISAVSVGSRVVQFAGRVSF